MVNWIKISVVLLFCLVTGSIYGQLNLTDYQAKYPDKNGVFLNKTETANISINNDGEPVIMLEYNEERLFLNDNYKYYTESSVSFSSFSTIKSITPLVYIPDGTKFKKVKINEIVEEDDQDGNVFHDDMKKKSFLYRGLEKGGKTTLNYSKELLEPHFFGSFYFSSYLPVELAKYVVETPVDMEITFKLFGDEKGKVKYAVETKGKSKIHTWTAVDMPDFDLEPQSVDIRYFATHLQLYINSYQYKKEEKHIIRNLDDLYQYYRGFVRDINEEEDEEFKKMAEEITAGKSTDEEKVKAIFYWVQDNIKYVAFEAGMGGFIPRKATLVCDRKYGDCKDMSSVLYKMINSIGIEAHYTWIGSRDIPYTYNELPTPSTDNHMICSYFNGKEHVFLDATGKNLPYGMPTSFIQGKEALIGISETEYETVKVPIVKMQDCLTMDTVYVRIEDGLVLGEGKVMYTGYSSIYLSSFINNLSQKKKEEFYTYSFKKGNNKCESEVTAVRGNDDREMPLEMDYNFKIPDYIRINGDEIYVNPFLKKYLSDEKINLETHQNDREIRYKEMNRNVIFLDVPEGYSIEYIPENFVFEHEKFKTEVTFNVSGERIEIQTYFEFDHIILRQEYFAKWNEMVKKINRIYSELIIFKKKN
ncbi:MAG: DUF3857 domain-containing protein [Flavobacteriales bacterium]|nr:DUF3857 domain-containing protein [Flavobacteriales bacterium]